MEAADAVGSASPALRLTLRVALGFLPLPAIGTYLHELGHAAVAKAQGYGVWIDYRSMTALHPEEGPMGGGPLVTLGGPLSTLLTGTLGLLWLIRQRRRVGRDAPLGARGWIAVALALFWSRQVWNVARSVWRVLRGGDFGRSDEVKIAEHLGLPGESISFTTAALGLAVCLAVLLWLVPRQARRPLLVGGLVGSLAGYGLWYRWLGPLVLPPGA